MFYTDSTNHSGWPLIFAMILLDKKLKTTRANIHFVEDVYEVRRVSDLTLGAGVCSRCYTELTGELFRYQESTVNLV